MDQLLKVKNLSMEFDGFKALDQFTFNLGQNQLLCIIGPNGAGKTTLLNAITGRTPAHQGQVWFAGKNITFMPEHRIARLGMGRKFQTPNILPKLSVLENLQLAASPRSVWQSFFRYQAQDHMERILERIKLAEKSSTFANNLSHGQKQWLEIGMILAQNPTLILLDEPVTGMTSQEIEQTALLVEDLCSDHALIVIEHDMNFIRRIATDVIVMHQGRELFSGSMADVQQSEVVKKVYLGDGAYAQH